MAQKPGLFVVIDGIDGSGKTTQHALLKERLETEGVGYALFDFPQYGQPSAYFVQRYLNGEYGSLSQVGAKQASLFYALDRFEAAPAMRQALREGKIVISNRFTASNMAFQGAKISDSTERAALMAWLDDIEYTILGIPRPNLNIILRVPASLGQQNVARKPQASRSYTNQTHDLHEADIEFLQRSAQVYNELCARDPEHFVAIECVSTKNTLLAPNQIHAHIWALLQKAMQ